MNLYSGKLAKDIAIGGTAKLAGKLALKDAMKIGTKTDNLVKNDGLKFKSQNLPESTEIAFATKQNEKLYRDFKIESLPFAEEYNNWLKTVDPSKIERHHVFSNKNSDLANARLFKEGLLDLEVLHDKRNIMPLPSKAGIHPTINTHRGGHIKTHSRKRKLILRKNKIIS